MSGTEDTQKDIDLSIEDDEDDDLSAVIRKAISEQEEQAEAKDDAGLDAPLDDAPDTRKTVSQEDGLELADKARFSSKRAEKALQDQIDAGGKTDDQTPPADAAKAPAKAEGAEGETAQTQGAADDLTKASPDTLLDGLDEGRKGEIARRLGAADKVMDLFKGRDEELKIHGVSAQQAMERLLYLNSFAQQKPDEYLAWVAQQVGGSEPQKVLERAAKLHGYRLVKEADEDDIFADPDAKPAPAKTDFGPDNPAEVSRRAAERSLSDFVNAKDESGRLKHPNFQALHPRIAQMAAEHVRTTGNYVTGDDLARFYGEAEAEMRKTFGDADPAPQPAKDTSAAQPAQPVADKTQTQAADPQAKARAASKNIDGGGQGASRRPALSEDADLEDVIRHHAGL
jgi:hypothetical protein